LWGKVERISPEAPVPVVALKQRENRLGGAANVALNIQSLGATPLICSIVGNDEKGNQLLSLMEQCHMPCDGILTSPNRKTTVKFRIIGNNTQLLRVDEETDHDLEPDETNRLFDKIAHLLQSGNIHVIIFEDYDKGVITPALIERVVKLAGNHGIPVAVDPKKKNFMYYRGVNLFKPNMKELREGLKLDEEPATVEEALKSVSLLQEKLNATMILATLSDKGLIYSKRKDAEPAETGYFPAHLRQIADVSGAGDTVISVASLCLAAGASPEVIARLANLAGGLVCEQVGVVPVNKDHLFSEARELL
ncbi:MAG TPA: PfkB family carbohydrate kinase, partial [Bacteroidales bacterium]|nr:PfkB family carbohydrate kinase [Bacteroidales bacterium]